MNLLYRWLEIPRVYLWCQRILVPDGVARLKGELLKRLGPAASPVLDVGCGPEPLFGTVSESIVGYDINEEYVNDFVKAATAMNAEARGVVGDAQSLPFENGSFAETRCFGLFHHLPPDVVVSAMREMCRTTRTGGRVTVFDNVWPKNPLLRPVAWLLRRVDRGDWIRTEAELRALCAAEQSCEWTIDRFTYSFLGLEGILAVGKKR